MKIFDFMVCDDVRREVGNKRTIIGAYIDRIVFQYESEESQWPKNKQLGLYATIKFDEEDPTFDAFKIIFALDQDQLGVADGKIKPSNFDFSKAVVFDMVVPIVFKKTGTMTVKIQFLKDGNVVIDSLPELVIKIEESQKPRTNPS